MDNSGKTPASGGMQLKDNAGEAEKENISGTQGTSDEINGTDDFLENIAMCDEELLETFLETGHYPEERRSEADTGAKAFSMLLRFCPENGGCGCIYPRNGKLYGNTGLSG